VITKFCCRSLELVVGSSEGTNMAMLLWFTQGYLPFTMDGP
jgi:hypothetical protein